MLTSVDRADAVSVVTGKLLATAVNFAGAVRADSIQRFHRAAIQDHLARPNASTGEGFGFKLCSGKRDFKSSCQLAKNAS